MADVKKTIQIDIVTNKTNLKNFDKDAQSAKQSIDAVNKSTGAGIGALDKFSGGAVTAFRGIISGTRNAVIAMKTLKGAKGLDPTILKGKGSFAQASFKWVLSNPAVSCLVVTMRDYEEINEYIKASGQKFSYNDKKVLYEAASYLDKECQIGCTACEKACPDGVKISDILRYNMYFKNYDQEKHAMIKYSYLPESMRVKDCNSCDPICEKACPYGVSVKAKLIEAHENLSFA